ncbi:MAG: DUF4340 domain-containing protein [Candidatus Krumholzibacteria bacterium]|nr:DUF4340 domain-containing protein [Candidatus Krumholzibacteria bacterium]
MKFRTTTWILIGALAIVAGYFYLIEQRRNDANIRERLAGKKLFPYTREDVERFVLINPKGERTEVEHGASDWKVVFPIEAPGDQPAIASFVDQVVPGRRGMEIVDAKSLDDYGLLRPFATLIIYHRGAAAPDTLFVGDKTPTSSNSYVRLGGSTSVMISSVLTHNVMNRGLFHLRDKNFMPQGYESIDAVSIRSGRNTLRLKKVGSYWWFETRHVRADRTKIASYLSRITDAVIYEFVREDAKELAPYGLEHPAQQLTLNKGAQATIISFGNRKDDLVYVLRTGLDKVILLQGSLCEIFDWSAENLRAMNLSFFNRDSVETIRYETPDTSAVLRIVGSKWGTASGDTLSIRSYQVDALLKKLDSKKFDKILTEPFSGSDARLSRFLVRVTLESASGLVLDRITLAPGDWTGEFGGSTSANAIGSLGPGSADELKAIFKRIIAR